MDTFNNPEKRFLRSPRGVSDSLDEMGQAFSWRIQADTLRFSFVSPGAERLSGFSASEWREEGFLLRNVPSQDLSQLKYKLAQATKKSGTVDFCLRSFDGSLIWLLSSVGPGKKKQEVQGVSILRERSERLEFEELKRSQERLELILANVADGITVIDAQDNFLYANQAAANMCGFPSPEEMLLTPAEKLMECFELRGENGQAFDPEDLPGRRALAGEKNPPEVCVQVKAKKTGRETWSILSAVPIFDDKGNVKYVVSVFRDFTERKRDEETLKLMNEAGVLFSSSLDYRSVLQSAAAMIVPTFADWCAVYVKEVTQEVPEAIAVAHVNPKKVEWARQLQREFPPDWNAERGVGAVLRTGISEIYSEIPVELLALTAKSDRHLSLLKEAGMKSVMMVPLKSRTAIYGVIALISAESGRRYTKTDLRAAEDLAFRAGMAIENALLYRQAQEAIRSRDDFLSIASHELKTPLTTLKLQSQSSKRSIDKKGYLEPEFTIKYVESVLRQSDRLNRLVEDMLDISRINTGRLSILAEEVPLVALAEEMIDRMGSQFRRLHCEVELVAKKEVHGFWDRQRIEQVLQNLLTNAVKYGGGKPIRVSVEEEEGATAVIRVRDQGIGIAPADQRRIFERFERAVSANEVSGMGLGLFIVRQVLELHGGSISVNSDLGRGAEFVVRLPLRLKE